ncbi:MAG: sulfotransferase [Verrucomicrobiota bacterium]
MPETPPPSLLIAAPIQRSGTTWLQRYLTAAGDYFIWGENHLLIENLRLIHERWPDAGMSHSDMEEVAKDGDKVTSYYFPNLSPNREQVLAAFRRAFKGIYPPPETLKRRRWGWKEVRYGMPEIRFIRDLFPEIKLLFIVRNPYNAIRSVRRMGWIDDAKYYTVDYLAKIWSERTQDMMEFAETDSISSLFIRYEDVRSKLDDIDHFVGIHSRDPNALDVLDNRLGSAPKTEKYDLTKEDIDTISAFGGKLLNRLGYTPPDLDTVANQ